MRPILILFAPLFIFAACTKDSGELPQKCVPVAIYSDKYSIDTFLLKTDLLYSDCLTGRWLDTMKLQKSRWFNPCDTGKFRIERLRYVIGNQISQPYKKIKP